MLPTPNMLKVKKLSSGQLKTQMRLKKRQSIKSVMMPIRLMKKERKLLNNI
jgi:hypothetical protein